MKRLQNNMTKLYPGEIAKYRKYGKLIQKIEYKSKNI